MLEAYRTFEPDLSIRSRANGGDGRTIYGIAVPYNHPQQIDAGLVEQFAPGAFNHQLRTAGNIPLSRDHQSHGGTLIGRTLALRDDPAGLYGEWRVSKTATGDETLELMKDGVLTELSIGFRQRPNGSRRLPGGVTERTSVHLIEVAVVLEGAYGKSAMVAGVRSVDPFNSFPNRARVAQIIANLPALSPATERYFRRNAR